MTTSNTSANDHASNDTATNDTASSNPTTNDSASGNPATRVTPTTGTTVQIRSLLVANRGEIAERVFHTCRQLGIRTVAVHSTPDSQASFVRAADTAVHLPGAAPAETYLRADLIIEAARNAGADAIHPGYGFLSENADFAEAVQNAGLIWVGPSPVAIRSMGSKLESKELMDQAGVPILKQLDPTSISESDLPVLIKASCGGGGRGMRIVEKLADLDTATASARGEAATAFGDDTVFCEPYLPTGHHIEVQVLADRHGTVWTLGERECSIQRRHQKIVEETPSPLITAQPQMRQQLLDAATAAAQAIDYEGAGTVEFLATSDGRFFFLEMNTRLQVEHPVTECVWGVDLVAEQIRIAEGEALGPQPEPAGLPQHAIEARLYAEDPAADWQPQHGTVHWFDFAMRYTTFDSPASVGGVRLDSGIATGSEITVHYDPMIAKVITTGSNRDEAIRRLVGALHRLEMHGPVTNRDTLLNIVEHPAFREGVTPTSFLDDHGLGILTKNRVSDSTRRHAAIAAALADSAVQRDRASASAVPLAVPSGWRNLRSQPLSKTFVDSFSDLEYIVEYFFDALTNTWSASCDGSEVLVHSVSNSVIVLEFNGVRQRFVVSTYDEPTLNDPHNVAVFVDTIDGPVKLFRVPRFPLRNAEVSAGTMQASMPGMIARIAVNVGDEVTDRQPLLWIEAMKMEHQILAPNNGVVTDIYVEVGSQVDEGQVLLHIEQPDADADMNSDVDADVDTSGVVEGDADADTSSDVAVGDGDGAASESNDTRTTNQ